MAKKPESSYVSSEGIHAMVLHGDLFRVLLCAELGNFRAEAMERVSAVRHVLDVAERNTVSQPSQHAAEAFQQEFTQATDDFNRSKAAVVALTQK